MSATDPLPDVRRSLADLPTFDLAFAFDDEEDPTQVTVYAETDDAIGTHWLSIDSEHAVDLGDVA